MDSNATTRRSCAALLSFLSLIWFSFLRYRHRFILSELLFFVAFGRCRCFCR